jgi:hypothetical protein
MGDSLIAAWRSKGGKRCTREALVPQWARAFRHAPGLGVEGGEAMENRRALLNTVAAIAGVFVPIVLFVAAQQKAKLSFGLVSEAELLDLAGSPVEGIQVLYNGEPLSGLTAATYRFENSGDLPIRVRDFEKPLIVKFSGDARLLSLNISKAEPENLRPSVTKIEGGFSVQPLLLNPGDAFTVSAYFAGQPLPPILDMRVAGIQQAATVASLATENFRISVFFVCVAVLLLSAYYYSAALLPNRRFSPPTVVPWEDGFAMTLSLGIGSALLFLVGVAPFAEAKVGRFLGFMLVFVLAPTVFMAIGQARRRRIDQRYPVPARP